MNDGNPKRRSMVRKRGDLRVLLSSGGARRSSGMFRTMQRPRLVQQSKVDGGGRGQRFGHREDDDDAKRHEGEMERPPGPIYKGRKINVRRENQGAEFLDM